MVQETVGWLLPFPAYSTRRCRKYSLSECTGQVQRSVREFDWNSLQTITYTLDCQHVALRYPLSYGRPGVTRREGQQRGERDKDECLPYRGPASVVCVWYHDGILQKRG